MATIGSGQVTGGSGRRWLAVAVVSMLMGAAGTASGQLIRDPRAAPPALTTETIVILPDTQYYSQFDPDTFRAQTSWIAGHDPDLIKMVIHVGDIVDNADSTDSNETSDTQWSRAKSAMNLLRPSGEQEFRYVVVPGNHDNPANGDRRDTSEFNERFGLNNFASQREWWNSLDDTGDNTFATFSIAGRNYLVVNLEFAPRKQKLCLANDEIRRHPTEHVIIVTHCYQGKSGDWTECAPGHGLIGSNGQTIWEELARRHTNVQMILSGHVTTSAHTIRMGLGGPVHEIVSDFQFVPLEPLELPFGTFPGPAHGLGWMRALSFTRNITPTTDRVEMTTFSVLDPLNPQRAQARLDAYMASPDGAGRFPDWDTHRDSAFELPATVPTYAFDEVLLNVHDFTINSGARGQQEAPRIAGARVVDADGVPRDRYDVLWEDDFNDNAFMQVKGREFRPDGCERTAQQTINQAANGQQLRPAVAMNNDGSKVVVWEDDNNNNRFYQIYAAVYDGNGARKQRSGGISTDIVVNQDDTGQQRRPDVAMDSQGRFVVVWQDDRTGFNEIRAQLFTAVGDRVGDNFTISDQATGLHQEPRIAMRRSPGTEQDGEFVVVWEGLTNLEIKGNRFTRTGGKLGWPDRPGTSDRTINQFSFGRQRFPVVDMHHGSGDFVVVWDDDAGEANVPDIKMAGFGANGAKKNYGGAVEDVIVNTTTKGDQMVPSVSINALGNIGVVWEDDRNDNNFFQIRFAAFDLAGNRIGMPEGNPPQILDQTVNFDHMGDQLVPDVHLFDNDQAVVVWQDNVDRNPFYQIVGKSFVVGQAIQTRSTVTADPPSQPLFALMDGAPWVAVQGSIDVDLNRTIGAGSISFSPGFTEAKVPGFATTDFPEIGSKLLVDVFVPTAQPASNYKGAVQLYWSVPGAGQNHQFAGQKELSPLAGGVWHTLEFDLPDVMRRLFLESHKNAELAFTVNTDPGAPARTLLDNLRFGGVLIPQASQCRTEACLSVCGPGKASCDGNTANGCETYLGGSRSHCGTCGHSCGGGLCINGACEPVGARTINAQLNIQSQWGTGYCADLSFQNQSLAPVAWEVILDLQGSIITSSWNGTFSGSQGLVGVSGAGWNNVIQPGASLHSVGFCAQRPTGAGTAVVVQTRTQFQ
jgi:cellulose binding protein with CBM2 domain/calcineurin-like phosphoesterase family protein